MNERDMEDLIAAHPGDFFPRKNLVLRGRQKSFAGVGRFDLLFEDEFGTNILMELKAVAARYEDASQLAKYKEELECRGEKNLLMWLIAPQISTSVREFLDRIGIEFTEIHVAEFRRVATRHGVAIPSESEPAETPAPTAARPARTRTALTMSTASGRTTAPQVETGPVVTKPSPLRWRAYGCDLALENPEVVDEKRFRELVDSFERAVPSRRNASLLQELRSWSADPRRSRWPHPANCSLLRWVTTSSYKAAVPHAEAIWAYLFGRPAPTWYVWRHSRKAYEFDQEGWQAWFNSLRRISDDIEKTYLEHNDESARGWPAEKQCQCESCRTFLRSKAVQA